ncbi:hypothetical protein [Burkholderia sp. Bp8991]|uniref:hypothetical protein n=1 Tax=Burkholderia sp. Bp8991 TaxID=2184553 RepID=UPI00163ACA60|nr:hypothetical protein [Burkholderia sp. Bp8991]
MTDKQTAAQDRIPHTDDAEEFLLVVMKIQASTWSIESRPLALMPYLHERLDDNNEDE